MPWITAATTAIFCRIVQFLYYSLCITILILEFMQMLIKSCVNYYFSLSFLRKKKTLKKYVNMFLACQQSKVTIKLNFYSSNLKKCRGNCVCFFIANFSCCSNKLKMIN